MRVKSEAREFKPVSIEFETQEELDLFFAIVEEVYRNYEPPNPKRSVLVKISDMLVSHTKDYDTYLKGF